MARFLLASPPLSGHVLPMTSVAEALESRGHEVLWVVNEGGASRLIRPGANVRTAPLAPGERTLALDEYESHRGAGGVKALVETVVLPMARAMVPEVETAVEDFRPDLLLAEEFAWGAVLAARRKDIPRATLFGSLGGRYFAMKGFPPVTAWLDGWLARFQEEHGLDVRSRFEVSPLLNLTFTSAAFLGPDADDLPSSFELVGVADRREDDSRALPWDDLGPSPRVLVSLGTAESGRGGRFFDTVSEALGDLDIRVILVAPDDFGPFPASFTVRSWIPQLEMMGRVDAVVTHGGANTVHEALSHGLPLVVAPITNDQPYVADCVERSGAGLRISFGRVTPAELRTAVGRILEEPGFRDAAGSLRASLRAAGGRERAADLLEEAARSRP